MFARIEWASESRSRLTQVTRQLAPREMVAALGGRVDDQTARVEVVVPLPNQSTHRDSFSVAAPDFGRCEQQFREAGLTFLGFAHSHPNGHATPSRRDCRELWTGCLQVITNHDQVNAFVLDKQRIAHPLPQSGPQSGEAAR